MHVTPLSVLPYPALQVPADDPPQPVLFDAHVAQAALPAAVLYVPSTQATQVAPLSLEPYPALHVPADDPPQPLLFDAHVTHAVLPALVLYLLLPAVHAMHETPPVVLP